MKRTAVLALVLGLAIGALARWATSPINPAPASGQVISTVTYSWPDANSKTMNIRSFN